MSRLRRNKKNKFAFPGGALICAALLAVLLSSCSGEPAGSPQAVGSIKSPGSEAHETVGPGTAAGPLNQELQSGGEVLTVYSYNEEFGKMLEEYFFKENPLPDGVRLEIIQSAEYRPELDVALGSGAPVDIYLVEPDYMDKYINSDYSVALSRLGISEVAFSHQYKYAIELATSADGVIKGAAWRAAPGAFVYRRSLAESLIGSGEPEVVEQYVSSWEIFAQTARMVSSLSEGKTKLIASTDDAWQAGRVRTWVENGRLEASADYMQVLRILQEENLTAGAEPWSTKWTDGMSDGSVLGYFLPEWAIRSVLPAHSGSQDEDWAAVKGPQSYYWGGAWICVAPTTDNADIVKEILEYFTINDSSMKQYCQSSGDYVNNWAAVEELSGYTDALLGGQSHYPLMNGIAKELSAMTEQDKAIAGLYIAEAGASARGEKTQEEALEAFYESVRQMYPEITIEPRG